MIPSIVLWTLVAVAAFIGTAFVVTVILDIVNYMDLQRRLRKEREAEDAA